MTREYPRANPWENTHGYEYECIRTRFSHGYLTSTSSNFWMHEFRRMFICNRSQPFPNQIGQSYMCLKGISNLFSNAKENKYYTKLTAIIVSTLIHIEALSLLSSYFLQVHNLAHG